MYFVIVHGSTSRHSLHHSLIRSLIRSLTPSLTHSLAHSLTHSLTRSLAHSLTHSLTHSLAHSLTHSLAHSLTHSLIHSLTHSLTNLLGATSHRICTRTFDLIDLQNFVQYRSVEMRTKLITMAPKQSSIVLIHTVRCFHNMDNLIRE